MKTYINSLYEPAGYYYDGLKLWVIYPMATYSIGFSRKRGKQRYLKGSVEDYYESEKTEFKNYHEMISVQEAESKYPEYFI